MQLRTPKKHAEAVKAAVQALRKLASQEAQAALRKFDLVYHSDEHNILHIGHEEKLLSIFTHLLVTLLRSSL